VDAAHDPRWAQFVVGVPSSVFHSPEWLRVLTDTYGFDVRAALLTDSADQATAGFAYVDIKDMMKRRVVSLPFSDYCDPLVSNASEWDQLITPLIGESGVKIRLRTLFNDVSLSDARFTEIARAKWHCTDLTPGLDALWDGIDGSARRAIRKARGQDVVVRQAESLEDVRAFFDLHLKVRRHKYGLLPQPFRFFQAIWEHLLEPGKGALLLAAHEGSVVGGVLYLEWQDTLYYKFNASDTDRLTVRPNDLLIWEGMSHAVGRGLKSLDYGLSDWDQEGLLRYKRKYASEERTITFLDHVPSGEPSRRDHEARKLLSHITDLLVEGDVPNDVIERAAELLYRNFV
jgi:CelD/BcsL family acetyltransferase involved in cellulose biosynthesis